MFDDDLPGAETVYFVKNCKAGPRKMKFVATRKSKKPGKCHECGAEIETGESYWWNGLRSYCLSCVAPEHDPEVSEYLNRRNKI